MQKEAWTYSIAGTVLGAFGLLLRWLQWEIIYDEASALPVAGRPISYVVIFYLAAMTAGLWQLSGKMKTDLASDDPEKAMTVTGRLENVLLVIAALAAGGGSALLFLKETGVLLRIAALLGILSAFVLANYPSLSRWGSFGAGLTLLPVAFFSLWIVTFYKTNAVNPVVWEYGMQILAIAGALLAVYRLSSYLFFRASPRRAVFACALGQALCLTVLMDNASVGARVVFAGWAIGLGTLSWVLLHSIPEPQKEDDPGPAPATENNS